MSNSLINISSLQHATPRLQRSRFNRRIASCYASVTHTDSFVALAHHQVSTHSLCTCWQSLDLGLSLGSTATDTLRLGALKVRDRNPALVIGLGTRSNGGSIGANNSNLIGRVDLLGLAR